MSINTSSIVIVVFVFLFIYYSNSFFFNRRRREVGTYSLLGMRKNQIGKIFLYETFDGYSCNTNRYIFRTVIFKAYDYDACKINE